VRRGHLGVAGANVALNRGMVAHFELGSDHARSRRIAAGRCAALRAGLQAGDLIVAFDGRPVDGIDDLHRLLTARGSARSARSW
jgi:S1-C subfamily serine protease